MSNIRVQYFSTLSFWIVVTLSFSYLTMTGAKAGQRFYYDENGNSVGNSITTGNQTFYYDRNGNLAGDSIRYGNQSYYYDQNGNSIGNSLNYDDNSIQ